MANKKMGLSEEIQDKQTKKNQEQDLDLEKMPLNSLSDYVRYNKKARALNKQLRMHRYPVKQCPIDLHPKQRIIFNRKDQPSNPLPVYLSNELIEFKQTLIPGQTYDLPLCVIDYLASKGNPIWDWVEKPDGSRETKKVAIDPRFALRTVYHVEEYA